MEVIHLWSAPRSLSTTVMYSFAQRDDIEVLDEPLYANFLRVTAVHRPYKEELLSKMESDGNKVVKDIIYRPGNSKYRFCKHMSKQRILGLPEDLMKKGKHFILIRNPLDILPSFDEVVPPSFFELGLAELVCIYNELCEIGKPPPVVDAAELQQDPEATLRALCNDLEIPFQPAMLNWEAGPKPIDGLWAPWWYKTVHKSTGFKEENKYPQPFPFSLYNLLEQSLPLYNMLRRHVKKKPSLLGTPLPTPDLPVPANEKLLAWVGNEIVPRESAKVSVFDSVVQGGDSVWEGLRVYNGKIFKLEEHLDRMFDSAKALAFENVPTRDKIKEAIFKTLIRNGMFDNSHIRLSLTRGKKVTSGMSPTLNLYGCTLIVLAEWKPPVYDNEHGIVLVTATTRRNSPNNPYHSRASLLPVQVHAGFRLRKHHQLAPYLPRQLSHLRQPQQLHRPHLF
ncbi:Branched-chain-amino-acid aminotransferase-like protein 2 isoform C [Glycine soja]|uniref:Branched-chain-amino-acid aminotransferase-like protein 2 isoform C n=1 Tax=Glycine soja TaxID=3848 RepID=A0A445IN04_GLYSO|nr:Branched-chain-amino-acid aminotransferase-like protein 2 isoform C [Glycine soja]